MTHIEAIIFDLGGVLINYSFERAFKMWAKLTIHTAEHFRSRFSYEDVILHEFEKGQITAHEYYVHLTNILNVTWTYDQFKAGWEYVNIDVNLKMLNLLQSLRTKYKLYVLSNTNELHAQDITQRFPELFSNFNFAYFSQDLHARKPNVEIYQKILNAIALEPQKVLFIDDLESNIVGAQKLGIIGIQMHSTPQVKEELKNIGILQ